MQLILLEKIQNLGELGDIVEVRSGYGRNFLIPKGKAIAASDEAKEKVEERRRELAKLDSERREAAEAKALLIPKQISVKRLAGEEGKLFGSVTATDVVELLQAAEISVQRSQVDMPHGPVKSVGDHIISVILHPEIHVSITISVEAEVSVESESMIEQDVNK